MAEWQSKTRMATHSRLTITSSQKVAPNSAVVGWLLIALSCLLVILFQPIWELGAPLWFAGDVTTAQAENVAVRRTWFSEGRRGRLAVYELRYEFRAADGRTYSGISYYGDGDAATGRNRAVVEYRSSVPAISRLRGHRVTPGGPWALVMLVPGLMGVLLNRAAQIGPRHAETAAFTSPERPHPRPLSGAERGDGHLRRDSDTDSPM